MLFNDLYVFNAWSVYRLLIYTQTTGHIWCHSQWDASIETLVVIYVTVAQSLWICCCIFQPVTA